MSNQEISKGVPGYSSSYLLFSYNIDNVMGKVLTLTESLGLKDTQEKATKDIVRDIVGSLYRDAIYLSSETTTPIMIAYNNGVYQHSPQQPTFTKID